MIIGVVWWNRRHFSGHKSCRGWGGAANRGVVVVDHLMLVRVHHRRRISRIAAHRCWRQLMLADGSHSRSRSRHHETGSIFHIAARCCTTVRVARMQISRVLVVRGRLLLLLLLLLSVSWWWWTDLLTQTGPSVAEPNLIRITKIHVSFAIHLL